MTPLEVSRAIHSKNRVRKIEAQERASYDYILASLIVKGVSITLGSKERFPSIHEAYSGLFDDVVEEQQEAIRNKKMNISALRFRQFAQTYNNNLKNKEVLENK
jgi:hypothetical protein